MAFLYREMDSSETRQFESHLQACRSCREEAASFGMVRESIVSWREEVLSGFVSSTATPTKRSAVAAFRQFFDLSPLWLKGAAAFAVLTFCVLVGLLYVNIKKESPVVKNTEATYTQQEVQRLIAEALAKQPVSEKTPEPVVAFNPPRSQPKHETKQTPKSRRPLSKAEREQLAADLRLFSTDDDLDLPGDRINH